MSEDTWTFENAKIAVNGVETDPMQVEVEIKTENDKRQGSGNATISENVMSEIEAVNGAAHVTTAKGETFQIMIRKAITKDNRIEFVTSGEVPTP